MFLCFSLLTATFEPTPLISAQSRSHHLWISMPESTGIRQFQILSPAVLWSDLSPGLKCETTLGMRLCVVRRARLYTSAPNQNVIVLRWFCDWKPSLGWVIAFDCLEISGPALTLQHSHSAKVPRPLEGSPWSRLGCTCRVTNQSLLRWRKLI